MGEERDGARWAELAGRVAAVRERIVTACAAAGRDPDQVALMAVTKTVPAADVALLLDLGVTLFGENRAQEAGAKVAEVAGLRPDARPRWHFVGGLQRNKARGGRPANQGGGGGGGGGGGRVGRLRAPGRRPGPRRRARP